MCPAGTTLISKYSYDAAGGTYTFVEPSGNRGVVSLSGFVTGDKIKRRAVEVAKGVGGVKSVVDAMYVKPE